MKSPTFARFGWSVLGSRCCSLVDPKKNLKEGAYQGLEDVMNRMEERWRLGSSEVRFKKEIRRQLFLALL